MVFVPQYVVGPLVGERAAQPERAAAARARLQFQPGVMITTVPWQLESSVGPGRRRRRRGPPPGACGAGVTDDAESRDPVWLTNAATPSP